MPQGGGSVGSAFTVHLPTDFDFYLTVLPFASESGREKRYFPENISGRFCLPNIGHGRTAVILDLDVGPTRRVLGLHERRYARLLRDLRIDGDRVFDSWYQIFCVGLPS